MNNCNIFIDTDNDVYILDSNSIESSRAAINVNTRSLKVDSEEDFAPTYGLMEDARQLEPGEKLTIEIGADGNANISLEKREILKLGKIYADDCGTYVFANDEGRVYCLEEQSVVFTGYENFTRPPNVKEVLYK